MRSQAVTEPRGEQAPHHTELASGAADHTPEVLPAVPDTPTPNPGCHVCSSPTGDDGNLCRTHTDELARELATLLPHWELRHGHRDHVPGLVEELEVTRTRQARITAERHGGRSAERPLPWNEHAAAVASNLNTTVNAWALDVSRIGEDERDPLAEHHYSDTAAVAGWLIRNLRTLRHHPEAGQAYDELLDTIREARRSVDRPLERIFAGPCGEPLDGTVEECREDLYAAPGRLTAICRACGARHDMAQRREWMLAALEDQVAYSGLLAGLITSLGVPIGSSTIRRWASAAGGNRIHAVSVDAKRRPLYRIGDVLDVVLKRAA